MVKDYMDHPVRLSFAIMAHPRRKARAEALARRLDLPADAVAFDPEPEGAPSGMRAARVAWSRVDPTATHHLVLQDDVTVPNGFLAALSAVVAAHPESAIMLCAEWSSRTGQATRAAALLGYRYCALHNSSLWAAGVVLPADHARTLSHQLESMGGERDSAALLAYARSHGMKIITPVPSLIQHDAAEQVSSWHRTTDQGPRRAAVYLDTVGADLFQGHTEVLRMKSVPLIPADHLSAFVSVDDGSGKWRLHRATDYRGNDYIAALGETQESLTALFNAEYDRLDLGDIDRWVAKPFLLQVWISCFLLGQEMNVIPRAAAMDERVARAASQSMIAGPLKRILPVEALDHLPTASTHFVNAALRYGRGFRPSPKESRKQRA